MSLFSRLFGGGGGGAASKTEVEPVLHEGCRIYPEPINEGGRFRIAARIEKDIGGEVKTHQLIRADVVDGQDTAVELSTSKAKSMIDQMGDSIFT